MTDPRPTDGAATATDLRCERCRNPVDGEDLFCDYCGCEVGDAQRGQPTAASAEHAKTLAFTIDCRQCGATLRYDAKLASPRCAFCGSGKVEENESTATAIVPDQLVPFAIERGQAESQIRSWLGKGFWRPSDLAELAQLTEMRPVYLPYWLFSCDADVHWVADCNATPAFAAASWCPTGGHFSYSYNSLLVAASGGITGEELHAIAPFDFAHAVPYSVEPIRGTGVEDFSMTRKRARNRLYDLIDSTTSHHAAQIAPGSRTRNVSTNPIITNTTACPVLLPIWIAAYRYDDKPHRVVLNGQTGALIGSAPTSALKVLTAIALAVGALLTILAIASL